MRIYIDIDTKRIVSADLKRSVALPDFVRGDICALELYLYQGDELKALAADVDILRLGIFALQGSAILSYVDTYTVNSAGGAVMLLPLNTVELGEALKGQPFIDVLFEVEYSANGELLTCCHGLTRVKNDLLKNAPDVHVRDAYYTKPEINAAFVSKTAAADFMLRPQSFGVRVPYLSYGFLPSDADVEIRGGLNELLYATTTAFPGYEIADPAKLDVNADVYIANGMFDFGIRYGYIPYLKDVFASVCEQAWSMSSDVAMSAASATKLLGDATLGDLWIVPQADGELPDGTKIKTLFNERPDGKTLVRRRAPTDFEDFFRVQIAPFCGVVKNVNALREDWACDNSQEATTLDFTIPANLRAFIRMEAELHQASSNATLTVSGGTILRTGDFWHQDDDGITVDGHEISIDYTSGLYQRPFAIIDAGADGATLTYMVSSGVSASGTVTLLTW